MSQVVWPVLASRLQPYVMLGLELQQRGHEVVLATEQRMEPLVKQLGQGKLGYAKISGDPTLMLYGKRNQVNTAQAHVRV
jgi:UDP:flavonoid glycosyltransferase YjiC (YdhE family)